MTPVRLVLRFLYLLIGFYLMWRIPSFARRRSKSSSRTRPEWPKPSVIVPARNEAMTITCLLDSLSAQSRRPREMIVVDDDSSDHTGEIAAAMGASVVRSGAVPDGWTGKTWALWQGVQRATGRVLVFLDADTWLDPDGLASIIAEYQRKGGLVSVQPFHVTLEAYEQLSAFFNIVQLAAMGAFTLHGNALQPNTAFGPCVVCSADDYLSVGGHQHEVVRGAILEDIPLARLFREHGHSVSLYGGRGALSYRMYPGGLSDLVEGWSKGFATGAASVSIVFLALVVAWITGCYSSSVSLFRGLVPPVAPDIGIRAAVYALYAAQVWWMLRRIGRFRWWTTAFFPLPLLFFGIIMVRSMIMIHVLRRVTWRGRTVEPIDTRTGR